MRRTALLAGLLLPIAACEKAPAPAPAAPPVPLTEVSSASTVLFQVFGPGTEPRLTPLAIVNGGKLSAITLDREGWQLLDSLFFRPGAVLPIYRDGAQVGEVEITRGMWSADDGALYSLPGCRDVVPQAMGRLQKVGRIDASVEYIASTTPLAQTREGREAPRDPMAPARTLANAIAAASDVGNEELSGLEFIARWLRTGAGATGHTLLATYVDPQAGDAGAGTGHSVSLLALAEDSAKSLTTSYQHVSSGEGRTVEFQRLMNHADFDGDGVDEVVLQRWRYAGVPELVVLRFAQGKWRESFRVSENWCLDAPASP